MSGSGFNELINFFRQIRSDQREDYQKVIDDLYSAVSLIDDEYKPVVKVSSIINLIVFRFYIEPYYRKGYLTYHPRIKIGSLLNIKRVNQSTR